MHGCNKLCGDSPQLRSMSKDARLTMRQLSPLMLPWWMTVVTLTLAAVMPLAMLSVPISCMVG